MFRKEKYLNNVTLGKCMENKAIKDKRDKTIGKKFTFPKFFMLLMVIVIVALCVLSWVPYRPMWLNLLMLVLSIVIAVILLMVWRRRLIGLAK